MLKRLKLTNFRKHEDKEIIFQPGLNQLGGPSEAGKTTVLEAICYALFGARYLREGVANVVSYDKPVSTLKVELDFVVDGVEYNMVRKQGGAELTYGGDGRVTGQTETKVFIERLLQCSADTAKLLLIADQNSVRGVLAEGGTAAGSLVEKLADLSIIEQLVDKIQSNLPSGNTKVLDAQILAMQSSLGDLPARPANDEVVAADAAVVAAQTALTQAEGAVADMAAEVKQAEALMAADEANERERQRLKKRRAELEAVQPPPKRKYTEDDLTQARAVMADAAQLQRLQKAYATKFPTCDNEWDSGWDDLLQTTDAASKELTANTAKRNTLYLELCTAKGTRINDTTCGLCKRDLSDVPEVVEINHRLDAKIDSLGKQIKSLDSRSAELGEEITALEEIRKVTERVRQLAGDYWDLDESVLPPKPVWRGNPPPALGELPDVAEIEKVVALTRKEQAQWDAAQDELARFPAEPERINTDDAVNTLNLFRSLEQEVRKAYQAYNDAQNNLKVIKARYDSQVVIFNAALKQREKAAQDIVQMQETVAQMVVHNELVKKLRGARPEIAQKLWQSVLGSISHYFTQIREVESAVVRTAEGFTVNGRSVEGLSGSTQDALGLSIRMALSKMFLPGFPFLVVDEPFANASANREMAGLGVLAAAGFEQVLLVTHSDLADSMVDHVITV